MFNILIYNVIFSSFFFVGYNVIFSSYFALFIVYFLVFLYGNGVQLNRHLSVSPV